MYLSSDSSDSSEYLEPNTCKLVFIVPWLLDGRRGLILPTATCSTLRRTDRSFPRLGLPLWSKPPSRQFPPAVVSPSRHSPRGSQTWFSNLVSSNNDTESSNRHPLLPFPPSASTTRFILTAVPPSLLPRTTPPCPQTNALHLANSPTTLHIDQALDNDNLEDGGIERKLLQLHPRLKLLPLPLL